MYIPDQFAELRVETMHELIRAYPLATIVTHSAAGLNANHIPLHLSERPNPFGTLRGHVARANPLLTDIASGAEVLAVFHGPDSYITPSWYPTKKESGKVAPTWNFAVVHAYGVLRAIEDTSWLRAQLDALTAQNETPFPEPWAISDAPPDHIERLMAGIVGLEMNITRLLGKWKVSQNQPAQNQAGVIQGLKAIGRTDSEAMATLVEMRAKGADLTTQSVLRKP